jgi:hypothetical protein
MTVVSGQGGSVLVEALGVRIRIDAEPSLAAELRHAWAACLLADDAAPDEVVDALALGYHAVDRSAVELLERITQAVTLRAVTARAGELLMVHACAVADPRTGAAVVCAGPSGMGKTTLASVLGKRWSYVTDETVAIDEAGAVLPYPKPLSVRTAGAAGKHQVAPGDLGLNPATAPLRPVGVMLLDRRPEQEHAEVTDVRTAPAVALLAEHTSFLARLEHPLRAIADLLHQAGGLRRVQYADAEQLVPLVAERMASAT